MIPFSRLIGEVRRFAIEQPDRRADCSLFSPEDHKTPECIVGCGIAALGIPLRIESNGSGEEDLLIHDAVVGSSSDSADLFNWPAFGIRTPGANQIKWLSSVQQIQDGGTAWGQAVVWADEDMKRKVAA